MSDSSISVIVPVYKVEHNLRKCLDSIVKQTIHNLEIILIDDGSPDNCSAICDEYATQDSRIVVVHGENVGASAARNIGLNIASKEWVGFVDSDDYIEPDQYEYLMSLAQQSGADIAQCGAWIETGNERDIRYVPNEETCVNIDHISTTTQFFANANWCRIYRREMLAGIRFDTRYIIGEDLLFNLYAFSKANKTVFGTKAKYHYVQRLDSICNNRPTQNSLVSLRNVLLQAEREFYPCESILKFCRELRLRNNLDMCSKIVRYHMESAQKVLINEIQEEMRDLCKSSFSNVSFSGKEKLKSFFIGYNWSIYRRILLAVKGDGICQNQSI